MSISPGGAALVFYVYVVFRLDGRPCYVGKGKGARWQQYGRHQRNNKHLLAINAAARAAGKELPVVKIRSDLSESEALAVEAALISAIGRNPAGPLVNLTDGGEGISGFRFSAESKEKIAAAQRGKTRSPALREQVSAKLKGRPKPPSFGMQIAAIQTGRKFTDERRANISKALRGTKKTGRGPLSDAAKENLRLKNLGKKASAQARARMSASQRARWIERRAQP